MGIEDHEDGEQEAGENGDAAELAEASIECEENGGGTTEEGYDEYGGQTVREFQSEDEDDASEGRADEVGGIEAADLERKFGEGRADANPAEEKWAGHDHVGEDERHGGEGGQAGSNGNEQVREQTNNGGEEKNRALTAIWRLHFSPT